MRIFHLVLALGLASGSASADVVVLTTGERLDVKSYEVRGQSVTLTGWDGRLRSLPMTLIDLEATEKANPRTDSSVPADRRDKVRAAWDRYGLSRTLRVYHKVLDNQLLELRGSVPVHVYDHVRGSFRGAFDSDRLYDVAVFEFANEVDEELLDSWLTWLQTPLAERMMALESHEPGPDGDKELRRYIASLGPAAVETRRTLMTRLDRAMRISESTIEVIFALAGSLEKGAEVVLKGRPMIKRDPEVVRARVTQGVERTNRESLLFAYRSVSGEDLETYASYWESPEGKRVTEALKKSLLAAANFGSAAAIETLTSGRQVIP